ncbi:MAG: hypothetical protein RLZZ609_2739 [Cyanobacteriota bacterium]|jgi:hypothetical protein
MRIFVGGSLRDVPRDSDLCRQFVAALGTEIVKQGHVLLNGCRSSLDQEIATAAMEWLKRNEVNPKDRIISYCLKSDTPIHTFGTVRYSALLDWQMNHCELDVPEQIELAGATIFIAGSEGTFWSKNWASFARKLILGIPRFGGAGETIYNHELKHLRETSPSVAEDYETLNSLTDNMIDFAKEVVSLVERMVTPRNVFTIMSFKKEFRDVFASCKEVCREFKFEAERTDESTSLERIVPRIETGIRKSAFVIADVSEPSPNVFYELGYAKALGKHVIVTARKGTELPFDLGDIPTIFWEIQEDLKEGLRRYLAGLVSHYGR